MYRSTRGAKPPTLLNPSSVDDFIRVSLEKQISSMTHSPKTGSLHAFYMNLMEKRLISIVLEETGGNQSRTAQILGINRNTLRKKIEEHKVVIPKKNRQANSLPT